MFDFVTQWSDILCGLFLRENQIRIFHFSVFLLFKTFLGCKNSWLQHLFYIIEASKLARLYVKIGGPCDISIQVIDIFLSLYAGFKLTF